MAYITLDELKEILPDILDEWMDGDDESWEWIFQEIEQKCHVGKRHKGKKQKKEKIRKDVDGLTKTMEDFDARISALSNKVSKLNDICNAHTVRLDNMVQDIKAAKTMAQTAKQRTEIDYTKCSKEKSDADVVQEVYNRMSGRGATFEELNTFRNLIQKYDALEKKEIPVIKRMCETCRYSSNMDGSPKSFDAPPCNTCNRNNKWEAKDNG